MPNTPSSVSIRSTCAPCKSRLAPSWSCSSPSARCHPHLTRARASALAAGRCWRQPTSSKRQWSRWMHRQPAPATTSFGSRKVRVVRGDTAPTNVIGGDGVSCGYQFTVGVRYLIDLDEVQPGRFAASICGHTKPLVTARGILDYLSQSPLSERARVWGRVSTVNAGDRWMQPGGPPVPAAEVILQGDRTRSATANANGEFSFTGVPDGSYELSIAVPPDRADLELPPPRRFTLSETSTCVDLRYGRALGGARLWYRSRRYRQRQTPGVRVEIFPAPDSSEWAGGHRSWQPRTRRQRPVHPVNRVPPGRYVGGIGVPFPTEPHPVVPALARGADGSSTITVGRGGHLDVGVVIARPAPLVQISGAVLAPSGTPVESIVPHPAAARWTDDRTRRGRHDASGRPVQVRGASRGSLPRAGGVRSTGRRSCRVRGRS